MAVPLIPHKPIPLERSVRWVPAGSRTPPGMVDLEEGALFLTQDALLALDAHARRATGEADVLGFLLGERFECPDSGAHYAVVSAVVESAHLIPEGAPEQIPNEEWLGIQLEVRRRRLELIGWYHSAPFVGPAPARQDLQTQYERFPEPWQCGVVIASGGDRPAGGIFRTATPDTESPGGAFVPFHELLDPESILPSGARRSVVRWRNYTTGATIVTDPRGGPVDGLARPPARAQGGRPAVPLGGTVPVLIPTRSEAHDAEDLGRPAPPPSERGGGGWREARDEDEWEDHGAEHPRARRGPRLVPALLVLLLAAGALWGWQRFGRTAGERVATAADSLRATVSGGEAASTPAAPPAAPARSPATGSAGAPESAAPAPASAAAATAPSAVLARFDALADTLDQAISAYHDRRTDFDLHRIDCTGLARGYRTADDALVALAEVYRNAGEGIGAEREQRYRGMVAGMGLVNRDFDESRCERP